jgi:hypothetical protein
VLFMLNICNKLSDFFSFMGIKPDSVPLSKKKKKCWNKDTHVTG